MINSLQNLLQNLLQNFTNCATVAQSLINQANIYQDQGNRELAIIYYQRAIALYPYSLKIHQQLKNLNISPTNDQPEKSQEYCQLANKYLEKQEIFEAIVAYETAISFNQQSSLAYQKLGEILINLEQWETASHVLEIAIYLNPDFPWNYPKLGDAYSHLEQWLQAKQAYQQTIKLIPDFPWAYHKLAKIQTQLGKIAEAIVNHQQVIKFKSDAWESWEKLIKLLIQVGQYEEAIAHCQGLQKINPQVGWSWGLLGDIYSQQGEYTKAIESYKTSIKVKPDYVWGYLKLANVLSSQGDLQQAINYYQKALEYQPNNTEIYKKISQYYEQLGDLEQVIIIYKKLLEKQPDNWQNYHKLGEILISQKRVTEAIDIYNQAINAQVESWKIYVALGNILIEENNQPEQAINCYLKAISIRPYDENSYLHLRGLFNYKLIKLNSQLLQKLIDNYQNIIECHPQAIDAHINLANILAETGQLPRAINHYKQALHHKLVNDYPNLLLSSNSGKAQPNFLIIGTPKGGTTALYGYLSSHPQILAALHKEISFFDTKFHLGLDWYSAHFPNFSNKQNNDLLTGEATPNYMYSQIVCQRIYDCFPAVKLIIVLRNPIDRGISHYYMAKKIGIEKRDLTTVIDEEIKILKKLPKKLENHQDLTRISNQLKTGKNYFQSGLYIYFLFGWLEKFSSNQILILSNEEMSKNTDQVMRNTYQFLGLPHYPLTEYRKYFTGKYNNEMTQQQRENLAELFYPHNNLLEEYLDRKFEWI